MPPWTLPNIPIEPQHESLALGPMGPDQTETHGTPPIEPWDPTWNLLYLAYELTQNTTLWKALWEILRANFLNSSHQFLEFKSKEAIQHQGANSLHLTKKQEKARGVYVSQEMKV